MAFPALKRHFFLLVLFLIPFSKGNALPLDSAFQNDIFYIKLLKTNSQVPIFYNDQVRKAIQNLLKNTNNSTSIYLGKVQYYYQKYISLFESKGVPKQLFLSVFSNSYCNPNYTDIDGASGLWAFPFAIAKKYDLKTNSYVDERRNSDKSTTAAVKYFNDLNTIYKDWLKTLVAFRIGPINMNMAIHKSGNQLDYDFIHTHLIPQHQEIATQYMAFWYIWNFHQEYKIISQKYRVPDSDTVQVQQEISFSALAYQLNINEEVLKTLNSELRLNIVPMFYNNVGLKLPKDKIALYHEKKLEIFPQLAVSNRDSLLNDSIILDNTFDITRKPITPPSPETSTSNKKNFITYTVKHGDGLLLLADIFDCKTTDIKRWNGIKKDMIFKGQKLKIEVPSNKVSTYKKINAMSMSEKRRLAKKR
jgi:membrane-bound lytic murein transglycosylase D